MATEHGWPAWARGLLETIVACVEFKGIGSLQGMYYAAEDGEDDAHVLEVAPALAELAVAGPDDGEAVWPVIHHVDLLEIQRAFDGSRRSGCCRTTTTRARSSRSKARC